MPQGGLEALETKNPLDILAYQYDIVCNGVELSSGAIRNHRPDIMYKAFEIAGYSREHVDEKFSGMINAFKCGAPPHGGSAPGVDRIVMLLADEPNIREIIAFPMNQQAEDLMMGAPSYVEDKQLKELGLPVVKPAGRKRVAPPLSSEVTAELEANNCPGCGMPMTLDPILKGNKPVTEAPFFYRSCQNKQCKNFDLGDFI
jgi:aspartyl-tRNA synthetase